MCPLVSKHGNGKLTKIAHLQQFDAIPNEMPIWFGDFPASHV
jgi:hypothetical protein